MTFTSVALVIIGTLDAPGKRTTATLRWLFSSSNKKKGPRNKPPRAVGAISLDGRPHWRGGGRRGYGSCRNPFFHDEPCLPDYCTVTLPIMAYGKMALK